MRHGKELITQMIAGLSAELAAEPCKTACTALLTAAGGAGIIAALGPVGAAIVPLTLFGGTTLLQICRQKKVEAKEAEQLQRIQHAMDRLATHQNEARQELADLALEQQWLREAIEIGPEPFNTALALLKADLDIALSGLGAKVDDIAEVLRDLTTLDFDTNWRVRAIEADTKAVIATQAQHGDILSQIVASNARLEAALASQGKSREEIEAELRPKLEQEIEAKLRAQHQAMLSAEDPAETARRLADTALTALRNKDFATRAAEVGSGLAVLESLERDATAHERAADLHIETSIAIWRKTAEWAYLVGEIDKCEHAIRRILAVLPHDRDATTRLGHVMELRGEFGEAARLYTRVQETATDNAWLAISLGNIGRIEQKRGNLDVARACHNEAMALYQELDHPMGMVAACANLGLIELMRGSLDEAKMFQMKALVMSGQCGRPEGEADAYANLGLIEMARGNLTAAQACHKQSLAINSRINCIRGIATACGNLGVIEQKRGNLDKAEAYHRRSLALNERLRNFEGIADVYSNLGGLALRRGNLEAAEAYFKRALARHEALGLLEGMATSYGNLGIIEQQRGDLHRGEAFQKKSLEINLRLDCLEGIAAAYTNLGVIEQERGNLDAAADYHRRALKLDEKQLSSEGMAISNGNLGLIEHRRGNAKEASRLWILARDLFRKIGAKDREAQAQRSLDQAGCEDQ